MWRQAVKFSLYLVAHLKGVDESRDALFCDSGVDTCKLLECLIGVGITLTAQNGLDSLGNHAPHRVEIAVDCSLVQQQLIHALECRL